MSYRLVEPVVLSQYNVVHVTNTNISTPFGGTDSVTLSVWLGYQATVDGPVEAVTTLALPVDDQGLAAAMLTPVQDEAIRDALSERIYAYVQAKGIITAGAVAFTYSPA